MTGARAFRRLYERAFALVVALYAVVLVAAPFEHHDLACHLKTPQHCTSCVSSPFSTGSHARFTPDASQHTDVGRTVVVQFLPESALFVSPSSGRSPPSNS